jgi:hypothetical protein
MTIRNITIEECAALLEAAQEVIAKCDMEQTGSAGHALRNMKYIIDDITSSLS